MKHSRHCLRRFSILMPALLAAGHLSAARADEEPQGIGAGPRVRGFAQKPTNPRPGTDGTDEEPGSGRDGAARFDDGGYQLGVGIGGLLQRKAYTDIDNDNKVLPVIYFENRYLRFFGRELALKLPAPGPVEFSLVAQYQPDGYEASDSRALAGMEEREDGVWAGASATWHNDIADVQVQWLRDVMGNSEGQQARLEISRDIEVGRFEFTPHVAGIWLDDKSVDYYYGVKRSEVRALRPMYEGLSTVNVEVGLRTSYRFAQQQSVFLVVNAEMLGTEIKDSPLTDQSSQLSAVLGYLYMF